MKKIINFIKYNNGFVIILGLIFASAAGALANETSREAIVGKTVVTRIGMDNTRIISADLENFDMGLKIKSVKEDGEFYYVNFDYNAIDAQDGIWQTVKKEKNINVSKARLGDMDLGLYLAEELKQLTGQEMAYMKEVQSIEKNKGAQKQVESVEYTGLKGLVFNDETKEIAGYNPVKEKENQKAEVVGVFNPSPKDAEEKKSEKDEEEKIVQQVTVVKEMVSKETIMEMVKEALAKEQSAESSSQPSSETSAGEASSSSSQVASSSSQSSESSSSAVAESSSSESSSQPSLEATAGAASSESSSSSSAEASSSLPAEEAGSESSASSASLPADEAGSTSDVLPSQSSSSTSDVIPAASSSAESSSSEASSLPASEASSSSVAI